MRTVIRDVGESDLESVLQLNEAEVPHVGSVDLLRMRWYVANASFFRVVAGDDGVQAFLVGLRQGSSYESPNYRWFNDRYASFGYIDRVAVAATARRQGLARRLYDDFAASLPDSVPIMACEVNKRPANEASMRFHRALGFQPVGSLVAEDGSKEVAMLVRELHQ
jgi:uncharacterized protein